MLTWELLGAATGAGLASGREIASFFGRYGAWGYGGIVLATLAMAWLAGARIPPAWMGRWPERLWQVLNDLLLMAVGGAMLAGAGELSARLLPGLWPRCCGMAATLLMAWLLARHTTGGLAWVSRALLAGMTVLLLLALRLPQMRAGLTAADVPGVFLRGMTYGGFNAALLQPLLACRQGTECSGALRRAALLMAALLTLGQTVLLRHPAAMAQPMPLMYLASAMGDLVQAVSVLCLYLAILSTLAACMRSLGFRGFPGICLSAALGFTGVVDAAYPLLGGGCAVMMAAMRAASPKRGWVTEIVERKKRKKAISS